MQKKKLQVWLPLLFSLVMVVGMIIGFQLRQNLPGSNMFVIEKRKPVQEVLNLIESKYVDSLSTDTLSEAAISALLDKLDPHSIFLPAAELQQANEELEGKFFGIGIEFNVFNDTINVVNVTENGPAAKAGLQTGDKFLKVGDSVIAGVNISTDRIKKILRGPAGTDAGILIMRDSSQKLIKVTRDAIPLYSLDVAYMITNTVGYIRLNKFSETTYKEFMQSADKLKKQGMQSMILDLRDNGGGILTEATDIADEFLDGDKLITYTLGAHISRKEFRCKRDGVFEKGKLVVLANESTASASEVLIGALQDWDRATIIGRRTFGKGLVQEQYELSDGSGLRLTVARYYTPLGRSIQKSYAEGNEKYRAEVNNRYHDGELVSGDSIKHTTGKAYTSPSGKVLYSAGGITPDIFVSVDTTTYNRQIARIYTQGIVNTFVYKNYLQNKSSLTRYRSPADFQKNYIVNDDTWNSFRNYASQDSADIKFVTAKQKEDISKQIKYLTARQIWHNEGYFQVSNADDPVIHKALSQLQ
ncbi:S41 family peptidase [soil metagenome]